MADRSGEALPRRPVPGTRLSTSILGFDLPDGVAGTPDRDRALGALLRRARSGGVTTFVVAEGAGAGASERALARAFPDPDPNLVFVVDRSTASLGRADERSGEGGRAAEESLVRSLEQSSARLAPHRAAFVRWTSAADDRDSERAEAAALDRVLDSAVVVGVVRAIRPPATLPLVPEVRGPELYSGDLSLLDRRLEGALARRAEAHALGLFASDPWGAGRLDGRAITSSALERGPGRPPTPVRELEREFAPVLRLRPLTEGRRRPLLEVALAFSLRYGWTCAAIVPLPSPERLGDVLAAARAPAIPFDEWTALDAGDVTGAAGARPGSNTARD